MAENNSSTMDQTQVLTIGLVVIAVLLAAIIGVLWFQGNKNADLAQSTAQTTGGATQPAAQTAPAGMGGSTAASETPFDAKSATKAVGTPAEHAKAYYEACTKGDWAKALSLMPADKQVGMTADALKEQVTGYGIKAYKVTSDKTEGDVATVVVDQETDQYGTFENTWVFAKDGGTWYVKSKGVTGMK